MSGFIYFLLVDVHLFQHHILKRLSLFHCMPLLLCQRSVDYIYVGLFLGSVLFHWSLCLLLPIPHCLDYCSFTVSLKAGSISLPTLFYFFTIVLTIFCVFIQTLESVCQYLQNILLGLWLGLHWICRSSLEKLTSW